MWARQLLSDAHLGERLRLACFSLEISRRSYLYNSGSWPSAFAFSSVQRTSHSLSQSSLQHLFEPCGWDSILMGHSRETELKCHLSAVGFSVTQIRMGMRMYSLIWLSELGQKCGFSNLRRGQPNYWNISSIEHSYSENGHPQFSVLRWCSWNTQKFSYFDFSHFFLFSSHTKPFITAVNKVPIYDLNFLFCLFVSSE